MSAQETRSSCAVVSCLIHAVDSFSAELRIDSDPKCFALSTVGFSVMKSIMGDDGVPLVDYSDFFKFCGIQSHPPLFPHIQRWLRSS